MAHIFLIAGAPAVGKSTTAHALAAHFEKSIHIPVDDLRDMVVSGLVLPGEWTAALVEQLRLARRTAVHMAHAYRSAGFVVTIDDFWDPASRLSEYHDLFQEPDVHKILLFPSQHAAQERNLKRSELGDASEYIAGGIRIVYEYLAAEVAGLEREGWRVLDSSAWTVSQTVQEVLRSIEGQDRSVHS